ncbi:hypothetical protein [Gimesia aquarii]|uniref:Uncharacterized protein n=1 Tax=Gimesia aquarii TaxID=2527964 RepID=A0A517WRQ9_9PLAN|nr:hypothetical protein [Gimesia aquarii]QDU07957.1 hypothetical protein V202x_13180 [Gimesia aquarii]
MKGPGLKLDLDVRRLWKCPKTGETIRLSGNVVSKTIQVEGEEIFMKLVEEKRSLYRDPFHFDYFEMPTADQSSSERAAAAARSIDEPELTQNEAVPAPEQEMPETSVSLSEESEPEVPQNLEQADDEDEDSFGGGLL